MCVGDYAGFDEKEYTSKNGGKAEVITMLKKKYGYSKLFMIGDGITDLEACPPADAFIGKFINLISNNAYKAQVLKSKLTLFCTKRKCGEKLERINNNNRVKLCVKIQVWAS